MIPKRFGGGGSCTDDGSGASRCGIVSGGCSKVSNGAVDHLIQSVPDVPVEIF